MRQVIGLQHHCDTVNSFVEPSIWPWIPTEAIYQWCKLDDLYSETFLSELLWLPQSHLVQITLTCPKNCKAMLWRLGSVKPRHRQCSVKSHSHLGTVKRSYWYTVLHLQQEISLWCWYAETNLWLARQKFVIIRIAEIALTCHQCRMICNHSKPQWVGD